MGRIFKRIFKTLIESVIICFSLMSVLAIVGLILGANVNINYCLKVATISSALLTLILFLSKVRVNYLKNVRIKIFKTLVQSAIICFSIMFILVIVNALMGVYIRIGYYLKIAVLTALALTTLLCGLRFDIIFAKTSKVSKKTVPAKTNRKAQKTTQRRKRRIS